MSQHDLAVVDIDVSTPQLRPHDATGDPAGTVVAGPWSLPGRGVTTDRMIAIAAPVLSFGAFHVFPTQRLVLEGDRPLQLGGRAFDILTTLIERAGELVSKPELLARVWPDVNVGENNLKVQVAALRRALRDGENGARYISTVTGRGYWFVAPVARSNV